MKWSSKKTGFGWRKVHRISQLVKTTFGSFPEGVRFKVLHFSGPATVKVNSNTTFKVTAVNPDPIVSLKKALSSGGGPNGVAFVGIESWTHADSGQQAKRSDGVRIESRAALPFDVFPYERITVALEVITPQEPGTYYVKEGLVIEGVRWIFDAKSRPL